MTQPQPPPPNQPRANSARSTPDNTGKCQLLRKLLYDIPIPKTSQATNCVFLLKNLLKVRSLIDSIIDTNNTQPVTTLETLSTKLEELTIQVGELKKAHTHTQNPPITNDATSMMPRRSYAATTKTSHRMPQAGQATDVRQTSPDTELKLPTVASQHPKPKPTPTNPIQQSKRIIMRFASSRPEVHKRMKPYDLRYLVNDALSPARIRIIGAEYTRAGNIALTPYPPCTTDQLLDHCDMFGPAIAHGRPMDEIVFEHDRTWHNLVVGIKMPAVTRNVDSVEGQFWDEILEWNTTLGSGMKTLRLLLYHFDRMFTGCDA